MVLCEKTTNSKNSRIGQVLLMIALCLSLLLSTACMAKNKTDYGVNTTDTKTTNGTTENAATNKDGSPAMGYNYEAAPQTSQGSTSGSSSSNDALSDRKVIFTATLKIESTAYDKSIQTMEKMIGDFGGYIQDSSVEANASSQSSKQLREATYTVRIPSAKMKSFLGQAGDIGNIILNTSKGEDVTEKFFDTKAHLDTLKIQEERLLELLKKATVLKDIMDLEDRVSQVRYQIEQLTGSLNKLTSLVDLSTVTVTINEVEAISKPEPVGFFAQAGSIFMSSVDALVTTFKTFLLILIAVSPFLVSFGALSLIIFLIIRFFIKRKNNTDKARSPANKE
jgi:hypothetical protein